MSLKGYMRSQEELREASGYIDRPREFADLVRILDSDLRLITPTEPEGIEASPVASAPGELGTLTQPRTPERYFQLTHDYLVHSLREWLNRKQRETRKGRAELRLAERAALWNTKPENRHLPSVLEWANIRARTTKKSWNPSQSRMMKRAGRVHGLRALGLFLILTLTTWGGIETYGNLRAAERVESLKTASTTEVPAIVQQLTAYRRWVGGPLDRLLKSTEPESGPHLRASLASLALRPGDAKQAEYLEKRLLAATPAELPVIWQVLRKNDRGTSDRLRTLRDDSRADPEKRFRAACALANSEDAQASKPWDNVAPFLTDQFLTAVVKNPADYTPLIETLRPIRLQLLKPLASIFNDANRSESERNLATTLLADYASDQPELLANLVMEADPKTYRVFFPLAKRQAAKTLPLFQAELAKKANPTDADAIKDQLAARQARAAVSLVRLGQAIPVWPLLKHSADPRLRSAIVSWLNPSGTDPKVITSELERIDSKSKPTPAEGQQKMEAILFHPETSIRRSLILALGTYGTERLTSAERVPLTAKLLDLYRTDPDSGIHGAAEWTLRRWKQGKAIAGADAELAKLTNWGDRRWFVNKQGQTFAVIDGPVEFLMGSPTTEPDRNTDETLHRVRIPRRFAIATKEVSKAEWGSFVLTHPEWGFDPHDVSKYSPDPDGPMLGISWFGAAAYCNWLSEQAGLDKKEWCYTPNEQGAYDGGIRIPVNVHNRKGYRLPTEAEWEYACRSGSITSRPYGNALEQLADHAW